MRLDRQEHVHMVRMLVLVELELVELELVELELVELVLVELELVELELELQDYTSRF